MRYVVFQMVAPGAQAEQRAKFRVEYDDTRCQDVDHFIM
jgi:hypothetical protein